MARRALWKPARERGPIETAIHIIRDDRVILDADLARLYGVDTKVLNQAIKRNRERFPADFLFRLTGSEAAALRSQIVTSNGRGGRRYSPFAFTEHGVLMAATVLNSRRAIEVSVLVVRTFVRLRMLARSHADLARRLDELEAKYDAQFKVVFDAIRTLMEPPPPVREKRRIGFRAHMLTAGSAGA